MDVNRTALRTMLLTLIAVGVTAATSMGQALPVSKAKGVNIGSAGAEHILKEATKLLQKGDGHDLACKVTLTLAPPITSFGSPLYVRSSQDFDDVCQTPGVHVVQGLSWCDLPHPNTAGCSDHHGACIVVRAPVNFAEGALWAHEHGHNLGLCDVSTDSRVMNGSLDPSNTTLTRTECDAFEGSAKGPETCPALTPAGNLTQFIRRHYLHGTPYAEARSYSGEATTLLRYLKGRRYKVHPAREVHRVWQGTAVTTRPDRQTVGGGGAWVSLPRREG
jgi:hypothetical protein